MGIQQSLNGSCPYLTRHSFLFLFLRLKTGIKHKLQNGKGRRIQESQEEWLKHFCHVLTMANPSPQEKPATCSLNPPAQLTSHKWSHSSPKRWLEVPMMTTPSSNLLMHSKSMAKLMQKCSSIHS